MTVSSTKILIRMRSPDQFSCLVARKDSNLGWEWEDEGDLILPMTNDYQAIF
ncbi:MULTISPECIES: hypothetical protein [unclassified Anabaena]|uniref:hypothetical protein n=1 Tax=unclassified Anabaena TaxID=2619674 RepID=UPI0039C65B0F